VPDYRPNQAVGTFLLLVAASRWAKPLALTPTG